MFMPTALNAMFSSVSQSSTVSDAREYISSNAHGMVEKVDKLTKPYKAVAVDGMNQAQTFVKTTMEEVRAANSLKGAMSVIIGVVMTLLGLVISFLKTVRDKIVVAYGAKWVDTRSKVGQKVGVIVGDLKTRATDLPNSVVGKKVEVVSKRLLGDKRHDQTMDFLKTSVMPKVYKSYEKLNNALPSPSGSSNADLTTEGSVSAMSPAVARKKVTPKRK